MVFPLENNDAKEQVRAASDIVDVLGSYLNLRRQGRGYVALCPWHDDSRPSFQVNPQRQSWRCWVCGIGGDVFSFVMRRESIEFREALELLADRANIALPSSAPAAPVGSPDDKKYQYNALAWAERLFHELLLKDPIADEARRYLQDRGMTQDAIHHFHLGFAPNDWQWLCNRSLHSEYSQGVLEKVGLIGRSQSGNLYDRFKGRVIFPIRDPQARPIAFGGRILPAYADEKAAKYVNSPETRLFSKSDNVYALDLARDHITNSKKVIVVEGYTDVIALHEAGVKNAVAVLGTALGPRHIQLLRRYADTVYLVLDGDDAGQKRTSEVLELFIAQQVDLRISTLPDNLDPCDFVQQQGADAFRAHLDKSLDALEHKIRIATNGVNLANDLHGANDALEDVLNTLAKAPNLGSSTSSEVRLREHQFLARIARQFQVDDSELRTRLASLRRAAGAKQRLPHPEEMPAVANKTYRIGELDSWDRLLLELMLAHPETIEWCLDEIGPDELTSEGARAIFQVLKSRSEAHEDCGFPGILDSIDNESLRFLLIELDEAASQKEIAEPDAELKSIIAAFRRRHEDRYMGQQVASMQQQALSEKDELDILNQIIEQQRNRQGISFPTDG
ncbi:DNA primase [Blastopirellula marina]|uniref:DNA primase n=1 Tax=Blastopirellula marina TaxID=124 RepID=A0A2S8GDB8_9BACT|nr:DNA primase [Blastopirellula marina]PQO42455.1 DNA primase [Blastopirellula marina]